MGAVISQLPAFREFVAIKETFYKDKELGEAFEREAHLLIVYITGFAARLDIYEKNNGFFLVMQFIEGEDCPRFKAQRRVSRQRRFALDGQFARRARLLHSRKPPIITATSNQTT